MTTLPRSTSTMFAVLHTCRPLALFTLFLGLALLIAGCDLFDPGEPDTPESPTVRLYAEGLVAPIGIEVGPQGWLWVGEQGTGQDDSQISVITPDGQVYPFLTGLPSDTVAGEITGAWRPYLSADGSELLILQGEGTDALSMSLLAADLSGFAPGDPPLTSSDVRVVADIGAFVLGEQRFAQSNPYAMTVGPGGDQFIVDAGANALIRRDTDTGQLSVFATFEEVPNPTPVGPPMTDAVPTGIVFTDGRFYVSALTGFPFPEGQARIYAVDMQGRVSLYKKGFTALVDVVVDPRDGNLMVLQIARFNPQSGFQPNTGQLLKVQGGAIDTLVSGLNFSSGMHVGAPGELFVSSLAEGTILKVTFP